MRKTLALAALTLATPAFGQAADGSGLKISVAGDLVGSFGPGQKNRLDPREAEFSLYAPVDPWFDAVLTAAAHRESGASFFELHELYVSSTKLIPASRFKVGTFFLGVGRLNSFHRHDWPFVSAPEAHALFFDSEAVSDTGAEYGVLLPLPFYLDLNLGLTNGWTYGHSHVEGERPLTGTHYARLSTYASLPGDGGMMLGLNYLGRNARDKGVLRLAGLDLTAKWREGPRLAWLVQSEAWHRELASARHFGGYTYGEHDWDLGGLKTGLRFDWLNGLNTGSKNLRWALVPVLTWKPSEFSTFRFAYNHKRELLGAARTTEHLYEIQATFILGAHPAHDF
jgi:hypothetical protein